LHQGWRRDDETSQRVPQTDQRLWPDNTISELYGWLSLEVSPWSPLG
jgi:hypothetical protein